MIELDSIPDRPEQSASKGSEWLEDLHGNFVAKLREVSTVTRQTADGKTMTTFKLARVEAAYDPDIVQKLSPGQLLAIPNVRNLATTVYSVFEIADIIPMHYSMLTLDTSQPGALRGEFMGLIEKEWKRDSKSTWVDIISSPTGYIVDLSKGIRYERKYSPLLVGSEVKLLNKEAVRRFVCYVPKFGQDAKDYCIGDLLGVIDDVLPFTIDFTQLLNYHVGVFCHTGGGKSYLTSMVIRKALRAIPDLKVIVFDVSSEYGIHLLDQLVANSSRIVYSKRGERNRKLEPSNREKASEFRKKHVVPDALEPRVEEIEALIEKLFEEGKCKSMFVRPGYLDSISHYRTYGGLLESLSQTAAEKFNANQQASIYAIDRINAFLKDSEKGEDDLVDREILPLTSELVEYFKRSGLRSNSTLMGLMTAMHERLQQDSGEPEELEYSLETLVSELLDDSGSSPRLFVIDEEIETARDVAARIIDDVFRRRRSSFNLHPRILFVFDEAQEFVPNDSQYKMAEGTAESSRAVERLLRHGRKYHLHGWISTQRLAHLNTSALHQVHSYFVGTLPRPYDRQLVGDTFAIDDALLERSLHFAPGDWLLASYRATNTQNVPVFFHAINNEECVL